jgi:hypothetical protein
MARRRQEELNLPAPLARNTNRSRGNHMRRLFFAFVVAALLPGAAQAAPQFALEYDASILNVVTLGKVTLKGAIGAGGYTGAATVQTAGFAQLFDDTRVSASAAGAVTAAGLSWSNYELSHAYARKFRHVSMKRGGGASVTATIAPAYRDMGVPPATDAQKAGARDPVTTFLAMGRTMAATGTCGGTYPVFDGKEYYTLTLSTKANGTYQGGGYNGKAIVCWLRYQPIAGFKPMSAAERARIPLAEIWFATPASGFAMPLRVEVPTPFGAARLDLVKRAGV